MRFTFGTRDTSEVRAPPANRYTRIREEWESVVARMVCFADDTTLLERETATLGRKQLVTRVLADWKENVHPGKWHYLRVRHSSEVPVVAEVVRRRVCGKRAVVAPEPPSRSLTGRGSTSQYLGVRLRHKQPHPVVMEDHVELLGSILGSCTADTANRLKQARRVWYKIHRQLGRLGFSQRERYRVVAATVEASLFYASETRPFNTREMAEYQRFLNRCLRGVCLSEQFKMRDMKGHITMQDLRKRVGQNTVSTALEMRKLGYLGHMGRYAPDRLERQLAFGQLDIEGGLPRASKKGTTWRTQCCSLLAQLRHFFPESFRDLPWTALAAERDQWRSTVREWLLARQAVDDLHLHANRHALTEERQILQVQAYARLGLSPPTVSAPQFSQASDAAAAGLQAAPRPKRCASEWARQRVACPRCGIQTQRRQLRSHQQFTCPASRVAGTAPSARALQQVQTGWLSGTW